MKIAIAGSMAFAKEMLEVEERLKQLGHIVYMPDSAPEYVRGTFNQEGSEGTKRKIEADLIRGYYEVLKGIDALLVLNYDKRGIKNYIGGNTFLEMGFAYVLRKKIFLLNAVPELEILKQEIDAMQPVVLGGNVEIIK